MATKIVKTTVIVCDLDENEDSLTVALTVDGDSFSVDLCAEHRALLETMKKAGRTAEPPAAIPVFKEPGPAMIATQVNSRPLPDPKAIRAWAQENGYEVGDRGRIPADVLSAYVREVAG